MKVRFLKSRLTSAKAECVVSNMFNSIKRYLRMISRFFYWGWHLRWNYDWDHAYLYRIIYLKLDRMCKEFEHRSYHVCWSSVDTQTFRKLRCARECAKRLADDNYMLLDHPFYPWEDTMFLDRKFRIQKTVFSMEYTNSCRNRDLNLLCKLLKTQSQTWWS